MCGHSGRIWNGSDELAKEGVADEVGFGAEAQKAAVFLEAAGGDPALAVGAHEVVGMKSGGAGEFVDVDPPGEAEGGHEAFPCFGVRWELLGRGGGAFPQIVVDVGGIGGAGAVDVPVGGGAATVEAAAVPVVEVVEAFVSGTAKAEEFVLEVVPAL